MSRASLLLLLVLSVGLLGGTTCRFSSNTGSRDLEEEKKSGIQVTVDNRTSSTRSGATLSGGTGAGPTPAEVVSAALAASVVPAAGAFAVAPQADPGGAGASLGPVAVAAPVAIAPIEADRAVATVPEPGAALVFACGAATLAWRLRRRARQSSPRVPTTVQL